MPGNLLLCERCMHGRSPRESDEMEKRVVCGETLFSLSWERVTLVICAQDGGCSGT